MFVEMFSTIVDKFFLQKTVPTVQFSCCITFFSFLVGVLGPVAKDLSAQITVFNRFQFSYVQVRLKVEVRIYQKIGTIFQWQSSPKVIPSTAETFNCSFERWWCELPVWNCALIILIA